MTPALTAVWLVLGVALVISVVTDLLSQRILDWVTYPTLAAGLLIRLFAVGPGDLSSGFVSGAAGASSLAAMFALLAWRGRMGWGDVKLMAAVGACLGLEVGVAALVFISMVGALQAVVVLLWQGAFFETISRSLRQFAERLKLRPEGPSGQARHIPYGVAIALGSFWAMWWDRALRFS